MSYWNISSEDNLTGEVKSAHCVLFDEAYVASGNRPTYDKWLIELAKEYFTNPLPPKPSTPSPELHIHCIPLLYTPDTPPTLYLYLAPAVSPSLHHYPVPTGQTSTSPDLHSTTILDNITPLYGNHTVLSEN